MFDRVKQSVHFYWVGHTGIDDHIGPERDDTVLGTAGAQARLEAAFRAMFAEISIKINIQLSSELDIWGNGRLKCVESFRPQAVQVVLNLD